MRDVRIRVRDVLRATASVTGVPLADLLGRGTRRDVARARQLAVVIAVELTGKSLPEVGRLCGRDHTTVLFSMRAVAARRAADPALVGVMERIAREAAREALRWLEDARRPVLGLARQQKGMAR